MSDTFGTIKKSRCQIVKINLDHPAYRIEGWFPDHEQSSEGVII
jgi:hypothetical protein